MQCRYCLSEEKESELIEPCNCHGSLQFVHQQCLIEWIKQSNKQLETTPNEYNLSNSISTYKFPIYSVNCEICKYEMKCYHIYQNTLTYSLFNTLKLSITDFKNIPYLIIHVLILYYMMNECKFLIYYFCQFLYKPFKTKSLMRFANEIAFFVAFLWFTGDILKLYKTRYWEQRGVLMQFLPKSGIYLDNKLIENKLIKC